MSSAASSSSATKWILPEMAIWASAPPSSSAVTSSPVTDLMTWGPVMNIWAFLVMMMKSVSAGEYEAPPAQGPAMMAICGTTPDSFTLAKNILP